MSEKELDFIEALNEKQRAFAEHYAGSGERMPSVINAGYSSTGAAVTANRLLKNPNVLRYIKHLSKNKKEYTISSIQERQQWLSDSVKGLITEPFYYVVDGEVQVTQVPIKHRDRLKSAELLAKMRGELLDRTEIKADIVLTRIVKRYDGD